ncbi:DNA polymerase, partial [Lactococcus lactis]|nr:DNA polymerase [Lactococcus lactis]
MDKHKLNNFFDYSLEPRRAILFEDVKSNYASIECVQRNLNPLTTSLCVMSRADNTKGLTLA